MSISKGQDFTFYLKKKKRPLKVLRGNVSFKDHTMEETTVTTAKTKQKKTFKTSSIKNQIPQEVNMSLLRTEVLCCESLAILWLLWATDSY